MRQLANRPTAVSLQNDSPFGVCPAVSQTFVQTTAELSRKQLAFAKFLRATRRYVHTRTHNVVTTLCYRQIAKDQYATTALAMTRGRQPAAIPQPRSTPTRRSANQRSTWEEGSYEPTSRPSSVRDKFAGLFFGSGIPADFPAEKLETTGIEPATSGLQSRRSPS